MSSDRVHRVVVLDKKGTVLGIVTSLDLLEHWNE
jgi:CBS-domain-containing membrane protein